MPADPLLARETGQGVIELAKLATDYRAFQMRETPVAIHLVGETIDAKRAHQRARSGAWIPLVRGVYADHDGDTEMAIPGHAVRIAHYLYPNAYLSSASAVLLAE